MNEKIKTLALKLGSLGDHMWLDGSDPEEEQAVEKFAELIIEECLRIGKEIQSDPVTNASEEYNSGREMGIEVFMNQMKKTFWS